MRRVDRTRRIGCLFPLGVSILFTVGTAGIAQAGYSQGGAFAAPGYGARAWAMGGAAVALGSDEGAVYWNPALLSLIERNRVGLSYVNVVPGESSQQSYLSYAHILKRGPQDDPDLPFAGHVLGAMYSNLRLELSDGQSYTENTLRLAYAYSPQYFLSIGASVAGLFSSSDIESFGASGVAIDVGARLVLLKDVTLGVAFRSILGEVEFDNGVSYSLPRSATFGIGYERFRNLEFEADVVYSFGGVSRLVLGGEYSIFSRILSLRGALAAITAGEGRAVPYLGIGTRIGRLYLDYNANFDSDDAFDRIHRLSLAIGL